MYGRSQSLRRGLPAGGRQQSLSRRRGRGRQRRLLLAGQPRLDQLHPLRQILRRAFDRNTMRLRSADLQRVGQGGSQVEPSQQPVVGGNLGQRRGTNVQPTAAVQADLARGGNRQPQGRIETGTISLRSARRRPTAADRSAKPGPSRCAAADSPAGIPGSRLSRGDVFPSRRRPDASMATSAASRPCCRAIKMNSHARSRRRAAAEQEDFPGKKRRAVARIAIESECCGRPSQTSVASASNRPGCRRGPNSTGREARRPLAGRSRRKTKSPSFPRIRPAEAPWPRPAIAPPSDRVANRSAAVASGPIGSNDRQPAGASPARANWRPGRRPSGPRRPGLAVAGPRSCG